MRNYYELSEKSKLATSLLMLVCQALTKAAKLGKDGMQLLDGLTVTLVEATAKRNGLMEELDKDQRVNTESISRAIREAQDRENREAFLSQDRANAARYAAERMAKSQAENLDDSTMFTDTDEAV